MRYSRWFPLLLVSVLLMACSGTSAQSTPTRPANGSSQFLLTPVSSPPGSGLRVLLLPDTTHSQSVLDTDQILLTERLTAFGILRQSLRQIAVANRPAIQVEVPHFGGDEQATLDTLFETGQLTIWDTGSQRLSVGALFDPALFAGSNPGDHPLFTSQDFDPTRMSSMVDHNTGINYLELVMKPASSESFRQFTGRHIGDFLTVVLDDKVLGAAPIQSQLPGYIELNHLTSNQQAKALFSLLKYGPLPVSLKKSSTTSF